MKNVIIQEAQDKHFLLKEPLSYSDELLINRIWYSADASLIEQAFKKLGSGNGSTVADGRFWASVPVSGLAIRKIHSGLPQIMVNVLSDLIASDMGDIKLNDDKLQEIWDEINDGENMDIAELVQECCSSTLVDGDGAFKIYLDSSVSPYPIVDYYSGDSVEYEYAGKQIKSVIFVSHYIHDDKDYTLKEKYTKGKVECFLYDAQDKQIPLNSIPQTADLKDEVEYNLDCILAIPVMFFKSPKFAGRGKSLLDGKWEAFDSFDESYSELVDAHRDGRVKNYIPSDLIPRDQNGGELLTPNTFQFRYITLAEGIDLESQKIQTVQGVVNYEAHKEAISSCLDLCLQGIMSPATLGIGISADASGESQKQKKDMTAITRNHITARLEKVIKKLVKTVIQLYCYCNNIPTTDINVDYSFGEYGALDFGGRIELLTKAVPGQSIVSIETIVDELWGDSKDEKWKAQEVQRLKDAQKYFEETPFPDDLNIEETDEENKIDFIDMSKNDDE